MRIVLLVFGVLLGSMVASAQSPSSDHLLIVPGKSVGSLALGDTHARALELYPFKHDVDQEFKQEPGCGSELNFVDLSSPKQVGNVFIRFRNDRVFQIDVASNRYKTNSGISTDSSPQEIRKAYPHLRVYILSNITSEALHDKPLIYWIGEDDGIAFAFVEARGVHKRVPYEIIVFQPKAQVCAPDTPLNSPERRELPYSLQP